MIKKVIKQSIDGVLSRLGYKLERDQRGCPLIYLHTYSSYEEYASTQIFHNVRKLDQVWADDKTLQIVAERVEKNMPDHSSSIEGICHGSRNGYEVKTLKNLFRLAGNASSAERQISVNIIGTDISQTATQFDDMIQWDFHDANPKFLDKFDFVYTNSLDQSWKPFQALDTWLEQIKDTGLLIIEHTKSHGVEGASEMDPFGVQPEYMPYVLAEHYGHRISLEIIKTKKSNNHLDCWLFVIKKS